MAQQSRFAAVSCVAARTIRPSYVIASGPIWVPVAVSAQYGGVWSPAALPPFSWPAAEGEGPSGRPPPDVELLGHGFGTFMVVRKDGSVVSVRAGADSAERFVWRPAQAGRPLLSRTLWDSRGSEPSGGQSDLVGVDLLPVV